MKQSIVVLVAALAVVSTIGCGGPEAPPPAPHIATAVEVAKMKAAAIVEQRKAADIVNAVAAQRVECGDIYQEAFDRVTQEARYYTYEYPNLYLECFNGKGFHPALGVELQPITRKQVERIVANPKLYCPTPIVRVLPPTPAPVNIPTPPIARDIGTGPCCGRQ